MIAQLMKNSFKRNIFKKNGGKLADDPFDDYHGKKGWHLIQQRFTKLINYSPFEELAKNKLM